MAQTQEPPRVQSLSRGLSLLLAIAAENGILTAKELSERVDISRQTTYHLLHTLRATGFIEKGADQRYGLGLAVHSLVDSFRDQLLPSPALFERLRELAVTTGETCSLAGWRGDDVVVMAQVPGAHAISVRDVAVGQHGNLHARASGKLLLAAASGAKRDRILSEIELNPFTPTTITDPASLRAALATSAAVGYAIDDQEFRQGVSCVAALARHGGKEYTFSILAPTERFDTHRDDYIEAAVAVARQMTNGG